MMRADWTDSDEEPTMLLPLQESLAPAEDEPDDEEPDDDVTVVGVKPCCGRRHAIQEPCPPESDQEAICSRCYRLARARAVHVCDPDDVATAAIIDETGKGDDEECCDECQQSRSECTCNDEPDEGNVGGALWGWSHW